jgi:hypothetical protein
MKGEKPLGNPRFFRRFLAIVPEGRGSPDGFFAPMSERMPKGLSHGRLLGPGNEAAAELKATGSPKTLDQLSSSAGRRIACPSSGTIMTRARTGASMASSRAGRPLRDQLPYFSDQDRLRLQRLKRRSGWWPIIKNALRYFEYLRNNRYFFAIKTENYPLKMCLGCCKVAGKRFFGTLQFTRKATFYRGFHFLMVGTVGR